MENCDLRSRPLESTNRQNSIPMICRKDRKMKSISRTIAASAAALSTFAFVAIASPAAQAGEFCGTNTSGMRGCGFSSLEQCQASAAGVGFTCDRDPYFTDVSTAMAYQPKHSSARSAHHVAKPSAQH
jgi:hypothetical protein